MMKTIILAGGEGRRLRPYTTVLPKPLMPLGDKPILEHIIRRLADQGLREIVLSVGYLGGLIEAYCGDGTRFGVTIEYLREDAPLGTVGPIRLIGRIDGPFIVMNGDILSDFDFAAFADFHRRHDQLLSIATYDREMKIELGVLSLDANDLITAYTEKPVLHHSVSMGIYCCSPEVLRFVPAGQRFDLPDLVNALLKAGRPVRACHHSGYWLDIGRHDDYERAQDQLEHFVGPQGG